MEGNERRMTYQRTMTPLFPPRKSRNSKMTTAVLSVALVCGLGMSLPAPAQTPGKEIRLSLAESISLALDANLRIRQQRLDPKIRAAELEAAKGRFNPVFSSGTGFSGSQQPASNPFLAGAPVQTNTGQDFLLGFDDPLRTGGSYGISLTNNRATSNSQFQAINPAFRSALTLDVVQPLLNGFRVSPDISAVALADNDRRISDLRLQAELIRTLSDVQTSYWELVFALRNLEVRQLALRQARDLLRRSERLREEGKGTISDVYQAQSAVASREADEIAAEAAVEDAQDILNRLIHPEEFHAASQLSITPSDAPSVVEIAANLQESTATALRARPEVVAARTDLKNRDELVRLAENQRLPRLDVEGSLSLNGLGGKFDDPLSQLGKAEHRAWHVGLALRVPFEGQGRDAELERFRIEREQARIALQDIEQQVLADVRIAVRQLETGKRRLDATRAAEDFARQALTVEERKHELGLTTSHDLLELQSDVAQAATNHLRAMIEHRLSLAALERAQGITLNVLGVSSE